VKAFKASSEEVVASLSGLPNFWTEASDSPSLPRKREAALPNASSTCSLREACTCSSASVSPVPAFTASRVITYWLPRLAIEPFNMAFTPARWQISRPISIVMRPSGGRPMNFSVCCTLWSGKTFRYGRIASKMTAEVSPRKGIVPVAIS